MAYYHKKFGVWLPKEAEAPVILAKPTKLIPPPVELPPEEPELPYFHETDELGIDWWICSICNTGYNSESIQKRHQTMKHKK